MQFSFIKTKEKQKENEVVENADANDQALVEISKKPIVKIENLRVVYFAGKANEVRALDGIDLEIQPEEYVIFFGPSGCGKSTLLNTIAGLEMPSTGKVTVDDQDLSKLSINQLAKFHRRKAGMIFQIYNLIPTLNVLDNVLLPQFFERIKPPARKKLGRHLLKKLEVDAYEDRLPQELSGGQQQRVGIARALINNPPIILADEAVGNLDSRVATNVLKILDKLNLEDKKTIISVTHNPEHLFYADRVFYMKDGKIIKVEVNEKRRQIREKKIQGESDDGGIKKERTELDLLLQAYPDLSSMQLHVMLAPFKAKILVAYLLNNLEAEEIKMMEQVITERLLDRINGLELLHIFNSPTEQGGLGFNLTTAQRFSRIIEEVVKKSDFLKDVSKQLEQSESEPIRETVDDVRKSLLEKYDGDLTLDQVDALNKGIEYRLYNKISRKEFQNYLDWPFEKGGVGLNKKSARNLSRKLELIMLLKFGK